MRTSVLQPVWRLVVTGFVSIGIVASALAADIPLRDVPLITWLTAPVPTETPPLATGARAMTLSGSGAADAATLASRFAGAQVLAVVHFDGPPTTLAADLSKQLQDVEGDAAEAVKPLIIEPARAARANLVARDWATEILQSSPRDGVVAAVLWFADPKTHSLLDGAEPKPKLVMVLVKLGYREDGVEQISRIAWGPLNQVAP